MLENKDALFFHSPVWYQIWEKYAGMRCSPLIFATASGKEVFCPRAIGKAAKGLFKINYCSPGGTYGGLFSKHDLNAEDWQYIYRQQKKILPNLEFRFSPFQIQKPSLAYFAKEDFTQVVNIESDFDIMLKKWKSSHLSSARRALAAGVQVIETNVESDWQAYFNCYQNSLQRWGKTASNNFSYYFFELLQIAQRENEDKIKLFLAKKDGKLLAGCVCFAHKQHLVYWHGAAYADHLNERPGHALQYSIIKFAFENGYSHYDMNPSGGHKGVVDFKKGFNTQILPANICNTYAGLYAGYRQIKNKFKKYAS